jgi:hypothetical protein
MKGYLMMKKIKTNEMWDEEFISEAEHERLSNLLNNIYLRGLVNGYNSCLQEICDSTFEELKKIYIDKAKASDSQ